MARVEIRLSDIEKSNWQQYCRSNGVSESNMMRMLMNKAAPDIADICEFKEAKTNKVTIRLSNEDMNKLAVQAEEEGYLNQTSWVTASVLANINRTPVLTKDETNALRESNRQLAAIGRNINQIARVLNIEFRQSDRITAEMIELLSKSLDEHREEVYRLINKSSHRWGLNYEPIS